MKQVKKECYVVPDWSLPYLINGDVSGLTDEEVQAINAFVDKYELRSRPGYHVILDNPEGESYFARTNDMTNEGASCQNLVAVFLKETSASKKAKTTKPRKFRMRTLTIPMTPAVWQKFKDQAGALGFPNASTMARAAAFYYCYLHPKAADWEAIRQESHDLVNEARILLSEVNQQYRVPHTRRHEDE